MKFHLTSKSRKETSLRCTMMLSRGLMESLTWFQQRPTTIMVSTKYLDIDFMIRIHQLMTLICCVHWCIPDVL